MTEASPTRLELLNMCSASQQSQLPRSDHSSISGVEPNHALLGGQSSVTLRANGHGSCSN
jgi:hypothetical protein